MLASSQWLANGWRSAKSDLVPPAGVRRSASRKAGASRSAVSDPENLGPVSTAEPPLVPAAPGDLWQLNASPETVERPAEAWTKYGREARDAAKFVGSTGPFARTSICCSGLIRDGEGRILAAANAGADRHPTWAGASSLSKYGDAARSGRPKGSVALRLRPRLLPCLASEKTVKNHVHLGLRRAVRPG